MRMYLEGEWFDLVPPGSTYENEFEALIQQHADHLFPGFHCVRFDPLLVTPLGNVKPDMALIDEHYRSWFIVEVELSTHQINRHVKPQVEKIQIARPDVTHADWIADRHPNLDRDRLRSLVRDAPHASLLLVNGPTPHWDDALRSLPGIQRAVVEVYRSRLNRTLLRINGAQPQTVGKLVTGLTPGAGYLSNTYRLEMPSALPNELVAIDIAAEPAPYRYRVKQIAGDKYLFPVPPAMVMDHRVRLVRDSADRYRIEE